MISHIAAAVADESHLGWASQWPTAAAVATLVVLAAAAWSRRRSFDIKGPISVNYHFTRKCNYSCGFCFHTAKTSFVLPLEEQKRGLRLLAAAGMRKVNFSGGEPFIVDRGRRVGDLVRFAKEELCLESVSIVTNGSLVTREWFDEYGSSLDILAVSCDSFDGDTNEKIGRRFASGDGDHLVSLRNVNEWCQEYGVLFKLNTVVNAHNKDEDMTDGIMSLGPICRWKIFKTLPIEGENVGDGAKRQVHGFLISDRDFDGFLERHRAKGLANIMVPENNEAMRNSYLILDECMRFLDCTGGRKEPSLSLLDVGVAHAMDASGFDRVMFYKRGGKYNWSKKESQLLW